MMRDAKKESHSGIFFWKGSNKQEGGNRIALL
jgi:hypothetical protein